MKLTLAGFSILFLAMELILAQSSNDQNPQPSVPAKAAHSPSKVPS